MILKVHKNFFPLLVSVILGLVLYSCEKENPNDDGFNPNAPAACFEMPDTAFVNQVISFTHCSDEKAVGFLWDFGDGVTSKMETPGHSFKNIGEYTVKLTVYNQDSLSNLVTHKIKIVKSDVTNYILSVLDKDITLYKGTHIFWTNTYVNGATITIMPGAVIKFKEGAGLTIGSGNNDAAAIIAHGTAASPIIFTADSDNPVPGFWDQIRISDGNTLASSFKYCNLEYGGEYEYSDGACIYLGEGKSEIQNCIVRNSKSAGIQIGGNQGEVYIDNNTFSNCAISAITTTPNMSGTIGLNNIYDEASCIMISGNDNLNAPAVTWKKLSIPYRLQQSLSIGSATGSTLTIEPGVEVQINESYRIDVGSATDKGKIVAEGTSALPIIFTSADAIKQAGSWNGINIYGSTDLSSSFKYCKFEYGGYPGMEQSYDPKATIHVRDKSVSIENCTFENYRSPAIALDAAGYFAALNNNTFNAPDQTGIYIHPNGVHTIGQENTYNVAKGVVIYQGTMSHTNVTWKKLSCPYIISGDLNIASLDVNSTVGSTLTIAPGTTIKIDNGVSIIVGGSYLGKGSLIANGASETITFTKLGTYNWNYIYFNKALPGTILNNCIIEYGASKKYDGAVHVHYNDNVTITNNIIRYSAYYGLSYQACNPTVSGNQLIDNANAGIYVTQ